MVISFALLILACPSSDENTKKDSKDGFEFKNTRWGMTVDEVKSSEANTPYQEENNLILYKEQFEDIPSTLGYIFEDGRLVKTGYLFYERHEDPDDYIQDYERIREVLIDDFSPPALDEIRWLDEETDQVDPLGKAVCEGMVIYRSEWIAQNTIETLHLEGADQKCRQGVVFESKEHFLIEREKKQPVQPKMKKE